MPVKQIKTEKFCKVCQSPHRLEIEQVMEQRALKKKGPDRKLISLRHILARMTAAGIDNPNRDNVEIHWKKHCELVDKIEQVSVNPEVDARLAVVIAEIGPDWEDKLLSLDEFLRFYIAVEARNLIKGYVNTGNLQGAQLERLFKGAAEMTKRKQDGAAASLAEALALAAEGVE